MSDLKLPTQVLDEIRQVTDAYLQNDLSFEAALKNLRVVAERHGLDWLGLGSKQELYQRAGLLLRALSYGGYSYARGCDLRAGNHAFWIFHADPDCCPEHQALGGLTVSPDHLFWEKHYPPKRWECSCYVVGTSSERGAKRLGGDPEKAIPDWWDKPDPITGGIYGADTPWANGSPTFSGYLQAIARNEIPAPS